MSPGSSKAWKLGKELGKGIDTWSGGHGPWSRADFFLFASEQVGSELKHLHMVLPLSSELQSHLSAPHSATCSASHLRAFQVLFSCPEMPFSCSGIHSQNHLLKGFPNFLRGRTNRFSFVLLLPLFPHYHGIFSNCRWAGTVSYLEMANRFLPPCASSDQLVMAA